MKSWITPMLGIVWLPGFILLGPGNWETLAQPVLAPNQRPAPQDLLPPSPPSPLPEPQPIPAPLPAPVLPTPAPADGQFPAEVPETIVVERFEIIGSTVFTEADWAEVTQPYTNRPITFAELLQVQQLVTNYYIERGYTTTGAILPPQTLTANVVTIQVVEGRLEQIVVTGTNWLHSGYVQSRLAVATQPPLNTNRLLEALQLLQLNPLITSISAELAAGTSPGTNLLTVEVHEADSFTASLQLDNGRAPSVGDFRRQVILNEANLLGLGDGLTLSYANTDGSDTVDIGYTLPLNPYNGTLSLGYSTAHSRIIEPPFEPIDIRAGTQRFDITLRQPLYQTPSQEFAVGLSFSRQESDITLLGVGFPLSPGAEENGQTRISALRLFQEWLQRGPRSVFALRSQLSFGLGVFDATINAEPPDSQFFSWRGQAQYVQLLDQDTLLVLRGDIQLADRTLVPFEQFALGGQQTVRGYRQDLLLTDNGAFGSIELRFPILRVPDLPGLLQLTPFLDVGTAWNQVGANPDPGTLVAVGVGLRWQMGNDLTARFDWGIPLVTVSGDKRTLQENGLYFSIVYNPF